MCGPNSMEAVSQGKEVNGEFVATRASVYFVLEDNGEIGQSHKDIRSLAGIRKGVNVTNLTVQDDGSLNFEKGQPTWVKGKIQTRLNEQANAAVAFVGKHGHAYASKIAKANEAHDAALERADKSADAALAKALKQLDHAKERAAEAKAKAIEAAEVRLIAARQAAFKPFADASIGAVQASE